METDLIIIVSVFSSALAVLFIVALVLCIKLSSLKKKIKEVQAGRMRIQKLKLSNDKNHAFQNPALVPDEELSRRGYSMYMGQDDVESGRHERQTGGQFVESPANQTKQDSLSDRVPNGHFVDELTRELDNRQQRSNNTAPPFLLQSIENTKRKTRSLTNPVANGRQSETNPNFIY